MRFVGTILTKKSTPTQSVSFPNLRTFENKNNTNKIEDERSTSYFSGNLADGLPLVANGNLVDGK